MRTKQILYIFILKYTVKNLKVAPDAGLPVELKLNVKVTPVKE